MYQKTLTVAGAAAIAVSWSGVALAQGADVSAVANLNGKLSFGYMGASDSDQGSGAFVVGSVAFPVSSGFGAQLDLGVDQLDDATGQLNGTRGLGLHLFTRDPGGFLIGVYGHIVESDTTGGSLKNVRLGIEGELYLGDYAIQGFLGRDSVSGIGATTSFESIDLSVGRYFGDMTLVTFGAERAFESTDGKIAVEHLTSIGALPTSLFAEASFGDSGEKISVGINVHFGTGDLSLRDIQRRSNVPTRLSSAGQSGYFQALSAGALTTDPPSKFF